MILFVFLAVLGFGMRGTNLTEVSKESLFSDSESWADGGRRCCQSCHFGGVGSWSCWMGSGTGGGTGGSWKFIEEDPKGSWNRGLDVAFDGELVSLAPWFYGRLVELS